MGWVGVQLELDEAGTVWVTSVTPESPAEEAGFEVDDQVTEISGEPALFADSLEMIKTVLDLSYPGRPVSWKLIRTGEPVTVSVTPGVNRQVTDGILAWVQKTESGKCSSTPTHGLVVFKDHIGRTIIVDRSREIESRLYWEDTSISIPFGKISPEFMARLTVVEGEVLRIRIMPGDKGSRDIPKLKIEVVAPLE